jgi:hypothetical protein
MKLYYDGKPNEEIFTLMSEYYVKSNVLLFIYLSQTGASQYQDFTGHLMLLLAFRGIEINRNVLNEDSAKADGFCFMSEDLCGQVLYGSEVE